jgi:molybdate/tungstate transport system substrate-binding protein
MPIDMEAGMFCVVLKGKPLAELEPRLDVYNMPRFDEPGMMMGEIPCLSEMRKSRAPRKRFKGGPPHFPPRERHDTYLLRMSGEMLTAFYGEQYAAAQGIMLHNFLGILAQKVTDVRQEKMEQAEQAKKELAPYRLHVLTAGVAMKLVRDVAEQWNALHPELPAVVTPGGSVDLLRDVIEGDPCDVLISADDAIIQTMLMPEHAAGYRIWGGNKMVIIGDDISTDNWAEKLLAADATFKHHNPYGDPGGYRAVMSMLLADAWQEGLSEKLMNHPGHIGMEKDAGLFDNQKEAKYMFGYYSGAKTMGKNFAELPACMDLSSPELAEYYAKVNFAVDEQNVVVATPINHAVAIPSASQHRQAAQEFIRLLLASNLADYCFLPRNGVVGEDPLV